MHNKTITRLALLILISLALTSCNSQKAKPYVGLNNDTETCTSVGNNNQNAIFELNEQIITKADLPTDMKEAVFQNNFTAYSKNNMIYKEFALRLYLARKQNKLNDPSNPPPIYELLKISNANEKDAKKFFNQNKEKMPKRATFAQMKGQLIQYLNNNKLSESFQAELKKLEDKGIFKSLAVVPVGPKVTIDVKGFPQKGNSTAKIKIIEISDYLCGHCKKAHPIVSDILKKYRDKISFTQINFALNPKGKSGTYVLGAYCAQKQGVDKFWKFHDNAFLTTSIPHNHKSNDTHDPNDGKSKKTIKEVTGVAKQAGLNIKSFSQCLNSNEAENFMHKTSAMLTSKGISGTPVFIINGRKIAQGAQGIERAIKNNL